jgi:hypothetical protein
MLPAAGRTRQIVPSMGPLQRFSGDRRGKGRSAGDTLLKDAGADEVLAAVRLVARGEDERARATPARARPHMIGGLAALSVGAAAIHFAVIFELFAEYVPYGVSSSSSPGPS